ncbi:hypothetical protein [Azospirillum himalayense]|uniref:Uncharacterized protein n=1 Tax=Azospirillum himalayense TaxID=654847 RepID=A0ABW0GER0_9PROT
MVDGVWVMRPSDWKPPAVIAPESQQEAAAAVAWLRDRSAPVPVHVAKRWVAHLAKRMAGDMPAETKLATAVTDIVEEGYPTAMFQDLEMLRRVARQFKWFPGWAELAPVLDAERDRLRQTFERLTVIARGGDVRRRPGNQNRRQHDDSAAGPRSMSESTERLLEQFWAQNGGRPVRRRPDETTTNDQDDTDVGNAR